MVPAISVAPDRSLMAEPQRSTSADSYNILGISKTASVLDVCKAYKFLVRKWHPDKNPTNVTEAGTKFTAINQAYKELSSKKQDDLRIRAPSLETHHAHHRSADDCFFSDPSPLVPNDGKEQRLEDLLFSDQPASTLPKCSSRKEPEAFSRNASRRTASSSSFSNDLPTQRVDVPPPSTEEPSGGSTGRLSRRVNRTPIVFSQSKMPVKPAPIEKILQCTLEELCSGCVKKIRITRDVITDDGTMAQEEEILKIKVKPGWKKGTKITFEGKGDKRPGTLPADIVFSIDEKRHPLFRREGDDLEIGVEVPLVQALTGCTVSVPLLGGENMCLTLDDIIYPDYEKVIRGQGMPKPRDKDRDVSRGDLILKFLIKFPTYLSEEQRSDVRIILRECSS